MRKRKAVVSSAAVVLPVGESPFEPTKLDPILQEAKGTLEDAMAAWRTFAPVVESFHAKFAASVRSQVEGEMTAVEAHQAMQSLTGLMERQARIALNMARATDMVARLRTFLAGGIPDTPDLVGRSDQELENIIRAAANGLPT